MNITVLVCCNRTVFSHGVVHVPGLIFVPFLPDSKGFKKLILLEKSKCQWVIFSWNKNDSATLLCRIFCVSSLLSSSGEEWELQHRHTQITVTQIPDLRYTWSYLNVPEFSDVAEVLIFGMKVEVQKLVLKKVGEQKHWFNPFTQVACLAVLKYKSKKVFSLIHNLSVYLFIQFIYYQYGEGKKK